MTNPTRRRLLRVGRVDQQPQTLQARVDVFIRVIVRTSGEFQAADDAQARTILAANGGDRLSQSDGVTNHSVEIQLVVVCQSQHISVVFRFDRHAAPEIQTRQCLVVQLDIHRTIDVTQAAAADQRDGRAQPPANQQPSVGSAQAQLARDPSGLDWPGPWIKSRTGDDYVLNRACGLAQEAGNVENKFVSLELAARGLIRSTRRGLPGHRSPWPCLLYT